MVSGVPEAGRGRSTASSSLGSFRDPGKLASRELF